MKPESTIKLLPMLIYAKICIEPELNRVVTETEDLFNTPEALNIYIYLVVS